MTKARDHHFDRFREHTAFKHAILSRYARSWGEILSQTHERIWIVDGFAGPGADEKGQPGSPLLLVKIAATLNEKGRDAHFIAIEPQATRYRSLKHNLKKYDVSPAGEIPIAHVLHGDLAGKATEMFALLQACPAFVFLDPFGAEGLNLDIVRRILAQPKSEVFALFSQEAICRHLGVIKALPKRERVLQSVAQSPIHLFPELEADYLASDIEKAKESDESLAQTKTASMRILKELFGTEEEVYQLRSHPQELWRDEALAAYLRKLHESGATHATSFAVENQDTKMTYFLIHAAKSGLAAFKMKEAVSGALGKSQLSDAAKQRMRLKSAARIEDVRDEVVEHFSGQEVPWANKKYTNGCVRGFALRETAMSLQQGDELLHALSEYVIQKRPRRLLFPPRIEG